MQGHQDIWTRYKWRACIFIIVAVLCLVAGTSAVYGQSGAGSIQGTVTDSTGAVIPGASIHIVNQATNVHLTPNRMQLGSTRCPSSSRVPTR